MPIRETVMNSYLPAVYEHRRAGAINIRRADMGEILLVSPPADHSVRLKLIEAPAIRRGAAGMAAPAEDNSPTAGTRIRLLLILFLVIGLLLGAAGLVSAAL